MPDRIKIISDEVLSRNWGILKKTTFDFLRRDGSWQRQVRETYDRGPAAADHCGREEEAVRRVELHPRSAARRRQ